MSVRHECPDCGQWCEGAAHIPYDSVVLSAEQVEQVRAGLLCGAPADPYDHRSDECPKCVALSVLGGE